MIGAIKSDMVFTINKVSENDKVLNDPKAYVVGGDGKKIFQPTYKDMKWKAMTEQIDSKNIQVSIVSPANDKNIDAGILNKNGQTLPTNPSWLSIFHEIGGHGFLRYVQKDPDQAGHTIDYENRIRTMHGMDQRGYDAKLPKPKKDEE